MTAFVFFAAPLTALFLAALARTALRRPAPPALPELACDALKPAFGVEHALAALIKKPTVSDFDPEREDEAAFAELRAELPRLFPRLHRGLAVEELGPRALLYSWEGADPALAPVILCAHFDVVPAADFADWKHGPFSGDMAEGCVWGRGAQDIKLLMASMLHAAERLMEAGFRPRRTLYFAFGGDEEAGGLRGAALIARRLEERGVSAWFALDEGGPIGEGLLALADRPLALVGLAEKGYMDIHLSADSTGGHASMPPRRSAAGRVARAVAAVEDRPWPARLCGSMRAMLRALAPYSTFVYRFLFSNLWLSEPLVKMAFLGSPETNALIRTTAAPTMLSASDKENVLASRAGALLNVRLLAGDSADSVLQRIADIVAPYGVRADYAHKEAVVEASPETPVDHEGFRVISAALASSFPDAAALPFLMVAGTDTKHYLRVAQAVYRFSAYKQKKADLAGVHGKDERIEIGNLYRCELFYAALICSL